MPITFDQDVPTERERILATAREAGYAQGQLLALQEAEAARAEILQLRQQLEQQLQQAQQETQRKAAELGALHAGLQSALDEHFEKVQVLAVEVAYLALARAIGEVHAQRDLLADLCEQALRDRRAGPVTLRCAASEVAALSALPGAVVVADPALGAGQCVLETVAGFEAIGLDVRMEHIRLALLAGLDRPHGATR
ncbi:MAG TPA: hypothetical protein VM687_09950 [Stenotrophomonas sp.]|nr:hypothetical protein [Stenotrophomonas sp.]